MRSLVFCLWRKPTVPVCPCRADRERATFTCVWGADGATDKEAADLDQCDLYRPVILWVAGHAVLVLWRVVLPECSGVRVVFGQFCRRRAIDNCRLCHSAGGRSGRTRIAQNPRALGVVHPIGNNHLCSAVFPGCLGSDKAALERHGAVFHRDPAFDAAVVAPDAGCHDHLAQGIGFDGWMCGAGISVGPRRAVTA